MKTLKSVAALLILVMAGAGLSTALAKEVKPVDPSALIAKVAAAAQAEGSLVSTRLVMHAGLAGDKEELREMAEAWQLRLGLPQGKWRSSSKGIHTYEAKRDSENALTLRMHIMEQGSTIVMIEIKGVEIGAVSDLKQTTENRLREGDLAFGEPRWQWMFRGVLNQTISDGDIPWASVIGTAPNEEYRDRATSSYSYQTVAGSLQVMIHEDSETHRQELIIGYPAIGSLN